LRRLRRPAGALRRRRAAPRRLRRPAPGLRTVPATAWRLPRSARWRASPGWRILRPARCVPWPAGRLPAGRCSARRASLRGGCASSAWRSRRLSGPPSRLPWRPASGLSRRSGSRPVPTRRLRIQHAAAAAASGCGRRRNPAPGCRGRRRHTAHAPRSARRCEARVRSEKTDL
ncbi:hypothetical protein PENTCL1PPCAC_5587, partial [Pristionchus entomophagus]